MNAHLVSTASHSHTSAPATPRVGGRLGAWLADAGITIDGPRPWDPQIRHPRALARCARGTLQAGESYAHGDWDCEALDEFTSRLVQARPPRTVFPPWREWLTQWSILNQQSRRKAREAVERHYDHHFDLFEAMLDPSLTYSCGYWARASSLAEAQTGKHDLICRKLNITRGMRVLDVGCGWGAFVEFAARRRGATVTGVTLSAEQAAIARRRTEGLDVAIVAGDYRGVQGTFDRVVSIGMFEHVGPRNYGTFFRKLHEWLTPDGLALLHSIGGLRSTGRTDPWIDALIFPGSVLPSAAQVASASEGLFVIEDWQNFGADYDRTLRAWHDNVSRAWPTALRHYPEEFRRRWRYYLLTCAGIFRARYAQLWQIVLSPHGVAGGYRRST
jgi:cyclopropane-fatty-acyl-phospholipid synthase